MKSFNEKAYVSAIEKYKINKKRQVIFKKKIKNRFTLTSIGIEHGISRQRVKQICAATFKKPKKADFFYYPPELQKILKFRKKNNRSGRERTRDIVRFRDKYTCQSCGFVRTPEMVKEHNQAQPTAKGKIKSLDVHHLDGLCGKKTKQYDTTSSIESLITLCHKCHFNHPQHSRKQHVDNPLHTKQ